MRSGNNRSVQHRIVGRDLERDLLRDLLDDAIAGHGSLVLISGEAGIGKTALVEQFIESVDPRDAIILTGGCYDLTATPPYGPWTEIFRSFPAHDDLPPTPATLQDRNLGGVASQEQLFPIVSDFLAEVSATRPIVVVLEDLHWSDKESLDLLRFVTRQVTRRRMLILASYRDDELTRNHPLFRMLPLLVRETSAERIDLRPLDEHTLRMLIRDRYDLSGGDADRLSAYLVQHSEGNPLFAVELLRSIEGDRVLRRAGSGWILDSVDAVAPPPLLVQTIERQLATLRPPTRAALEVAAVIGPDIQPELWQDVTQRDLDGISTIIEEALTARVIEQHTGIHPRFRHALFRDVLYHGIQIPRRRQIHLLVANALLETARPDPDRVADHLLQAEDERAASWLIRAGDLAASSGASFTAAERYEAALQMLGDDEQSLRERGWLLLALGQSTRDIAAHRALACAEEARQIGMAIEDEALSAWGLYRLGEHRFFVGQNGLPEMEQGLELLQNVPPSELPELPARFRHIDVRASESDIIIMQMLFGRYREALANAEAYLARTSLEAERQWWLRGHAEAARAGALNALGDPEAGRIAHRLAQDAYQRGSAIWLRALTSTAELQNGHLAYRADQRDDRRNLVAETSSLWNQTSGVATQLPARYGLLPIMVVEGAWSDAREIAMPFANRELVFHDIAQYTLGTIARLQGDPNLAWEMVKTGLPDGSDTEPGAVWISFTVGLQRLAAKLALDAKDADLACRWITAHDRWLDASERVQGRAESHLLWVRYHALLSNTELAERHARQAIEHAADPRQPLALTAALRVRGELALAAGQYPDAEKHLAYALDLAEACAAPYEQALCHLVLAELGAVTGRADDAWIHLNQARAICTPLDATPALQRATAIAAKLAVRREKPMYPAGLTPREVEVLLLVAEGLSDTETGQRLFVSPRTVNTHLTSIYNKIGVNSRAAATRFAVEHGLLDPLSP